MYKSFNEIPIWQNAMAIATDIFDLTKHLPRTEDYGFTSQSRRAALSVSSNIAEAFGRNHIADKINFTIMPVVQQWKHKAIWNMGNV